MSTRDYSDDTARVIDEEVEKILRDCEQRCIDTLTEYRAGLDLVARTLLQIETITGDDVTRLIAESRGEQPPAPAAPEVVSPAAPAPAPAAPAASRPPTGAYAPPPLMPPPDFSPGTA